jgi:hypothetical protein
VNENGVVDAIEDGAKTPLSARAAAPRLGDQAVESRPAG